MALPSLAFSLMASAMSVAVTSRMSSPVKPTLLVVALAESQ